MKLYVGLTVPDLKVILISDDRDTVQNAIDQRTEQCDILETECVNIKDIAAVQENSRIRTAICEKVREFKANPDLPEAQPLIDRIHETFNQLQAEGQADDSFRIQQAAMAHMSEIWDLIAKTHGWPEPDPD